MFKFHSRENSDCRLKAAGTMRHADFQDSKYNLTNGLCVITCSNNNLSIQLIKGPYSGWPDLVYLNL